MGFLKIGETDRDGRQKRIEHTGRHLRASRTGGVSLRAQTRVGAVNATANTNHGVRLSTRLAKNTQVAFQNGRFILRGRYGSDAAKINLSKSGVSVSTRTPLGAINWIRPGRSSFKLAGIQLRGHKAVYLQAVYGLFALAAAIIGLALRLLGWIVRLGVGVVGHFAARRELAARQRERLGLALDEVRSAGERVLAEQGVDPAREPARDLLAALVFIAVCLGRGETRFDPQAAGMGEPGDAATNALAVDARVGGEQLVDWLPEAAGARSPATVVGLLCVLAAAFADRVDEAVRSETLLALDDACLAAGPKTLLQEEMIDLLVPALGVDLVLSGES